MTEKSTRDYLLDTGLKLMHQHGYNATGLTEILKAADVAKGSFYHHFGSKEDFAAAALERYTTREAKHSAAVLTGSKAPPLKRLKRYFTDLVKFYGQKGEIPGCMMGRFSLEVAAANPHVEKANFHHLRALATHHRDGHTRGGRAGRTAWKYGSRIAGRVPAQ